MAREDHGKSRAFCHWLWLHRSDEELQRCGFLHILGVSRLKVIMRAAIALTFQVVTCFRSSRLQTITCALGGIFPILSLSHRLTVEQKFVPFTVVNRSATNMQIHHHCGIFEEARKLKNTALSRKQANSRVNREMLPKNLENLLLVRRSR